MNSSLLRDGRLLLYLFVGFRLMALIAYMPYLNNGAEQGITVFGDFHHYYNLASISDEGKLAYRDYWYEFPPIFPIISLAIYSVTSVRGADFTAYASLLGMVMIAFDVGNLILIRRIGSAIRDPGTGLALGWIYAIMAAPFVFTFWTFEPIVAFAILLAIWELVEGRDLRAGIAVAFGALTKLIPIILLPTAWRFRPLREAIRYSLVAIVLTALGLGVMLVVAGQFGIPSLVAQFNKASYQTVWALVDRNYKTGNFGPISDHLDPEKAYELQGNPPVIPWWLRGAIFGGIGLFVYMRTRRRDNIGLVAFATITVTIFFLWSQGWSPQWLMILVPLILLNFPDRNGVMVSLLLSLLSFVEYPMLFARTADTGGAISGTQLPLFTLIILTRTALLVGVALGLYRRLRVAIPQVPQ